MSKHTPGPWTIRSRSGFDYGTTVYDVPEVCTNIKNEQNARLISAAPELLSVCKELADSAAYWGDYDVPLGIVDRLNAAIAKAEGI